MRMGEKTSLNVEAISTGALSLDVGVALAASRGRVTEIYGPEAWASPQLLAMHVVAEAQRIGGTRAYVDAEHAMDPSYASRIGVDIDQLLISSRTPASRRSRSPTCWCAPVRLTWW